MALTNDQRENRALYNLSRALHNARGPLTRGQLYCASVNAATIERMANAGVIAQLGDRYALTNAGDVLLNSRLATGRASTI